MISENVFHQLIQEILPARLVAVTKTRPPEDIMALYNLGQRDFGENRVQEMIDKINKLPKDIQWHQIGTLQSNKVKYIAPFIHLIHSVDSESLLDSIQKEARKNNRKIAVLIQAHIADETTKHGFDLKELLQFFEQQKYKKYDALHFSGLMGMATFTNDIKKIEKEFSVLKQLHEKIVLNRGDELPYFKELSMGMSSDYKIAIREGATLVRIGNLLF